MTAGVYVATGVVAISVVIGLWDLAAGHVPEGMVVLTLAGIWSAVGRADARRRQSR